MDPPPHKPFLHHFESTDWSLAYSSFSFPLGDSLLGISFSPPYNVEGNLRLLFFFSLILFAGEPEPPGRVRNLSIIHFFFLPFQRRVALRREAEMFLCLDSQPAGYGQIGHIHYTLRRYYRRRILPLFESIQQSLPPKSSLYRIPRSCRRWFPDYLLQEVPSLRGFLKLPI